MLTHSVLLSLKSQVIELKFYPLEVESCNNDTQLQVGKGYFLLYYYYIITDNLNRNIFQSNHFYGSILLQMFLFEGQIESIWTWHFNPLTAKLFNRNFHHLKLCIADATTTSSS